MNRSDQINELAAALAKAQGEMKPPTKNKTAKIATKSGGSYSYKYSDLADTIEASKPLSTNGLSCTQVINMSPSLNLEAVLMHSSGQWISSTYPLTLSGTPQEFGSQLTYARRYLISCLLGIAADEDDDGASASNSPAKGRPERPAPVITEDHKPQQQTADPVTQAATALGGVVRPQQPAAASAAKQDPAAKRAALIATLNQTRGQLAAAGVLDVMAETEPHGPDNFAVLEEKIRRAQNALNKATLQPA